MPIPPTQRNPRDAPHHDVEQSLRAAALGEERLGNDEFVVALAAMQPPEEIVDQAGCRRRGVGTLQANHDFRERRV